MRRTLLPALLLLLLALPPASAQDEGTIATLRIAVQPAHDEQMTLTFDGLRPLARYQGICLPARARETRVHDDLGEVPYDVRVEGDRRVLDFTARRDVVRIDLARPAPAADEHPLYTGDVNFCVPVKARVVVHVDVPPDHTLFFLSHADVTDARRGTVSTEGPSHVHYSYEAPLGGTSGMEIVTEAPFRVFARSSVAPQAREVARLAAAPLASALAEAGLTIPFDTLRVLYQVDTPHAWEAGHYSGHGTISVKESTLAPDPREGYPYAAVKVLVHEAFHAASFPRGRGDVEDKLGWWLEGTARRAERHVDAAMPDASIFCERSSAEVRCWSFDDRITRTEIDAGYRPSFTFDPAWEPSLPQSDETRRFYYAYSEYIVGAWIAQRGEPAYRKVWDDVHDAFLNGKGCPCVQGWLESLLAEPHLYRPWGNLRASDPVGFDARVLAFVKDEAALQRALDQGATPWGGLDVPAPPWIAAVALALVARLQAARAKRRSASVTAPTTRGR